MMTEPATEDIQALGKGYRLTLTPTELQVQSRLAGGAWIPGRMIRYGEIRAVYRYERRNWSPLAVTATGWLKNQELALAAGEAAGMPAWLRVVIATAPLLLVAGAGYRVYAVLSPMLKVDAFTGPLVVPARPSAFFQRLGQRVREAAESANTAPTSPPSPAPWTPGAPPPAATLGGPAAPAYPGMGFPPPASGSATPPYGSPAAPPAWAAPSAPVPPSSRVAPPVPGPVAAPPSPAQTVLFLSFAPTVPDS